MRPIPTYHSFLAWLLLFIYLIIPFKSLRPYLEYKLNFSYISTVLCENKNKPSSHCNGKCYLNKELKKEAKQESQNKKHNINDLESKEVLIGKTEYLHIPVNSDIKNSFPNYAEALESLAIQHTTPPPRG